MSCERHSRSQADTSKNPFRSLKHFSTTEKTYVPMRTALQELQLATRTRHDVPTPRTAHVPRTSSWRDHVTWTVSTPPCSLLATASLHGHLYHSGFFDWRIGFQLRDEWEFSVPTETVSAGTDETDFGGEGTANFCGDGFVSKLVQDEGCMIT